VIRSRLFRKTLVFIVLLFGLMANASALFSGWLLYNKLGEEYTSKAVAIARSVAHSDIELIAKRDAAFIQSKIDEYLDLEGVSYVLVTDAEGEVLAHTFIPVIPDAVRSVVEQYQQEEGLHEDPTVVRLALASGDVTHVGVPVLGGAGGYVHIGMDRSIIMGYIMSAVWKQQGITMVVFLVAVIIALFFIRSISQPLSLLTEYAGRVARHDFSGAVPIRTNDEVGELAEAMQTMSHDLATLVDNLEASVADKTQELRETVGYISAIIGNIAEGLLVVDTEGYVARSNVALERLFGCRAGELEGRSLERAFFFPVDGEDGEDRVETNRPLVELLQQTLRDSGSTLLSPVELECCDREGNCFPAELSVVRFEREGMATIICLLRDVTERRRTHDLMLQANEHLEQKVAERTRELSRMNSQLMVENAERRGVEMALRRTEERYRSIFENAIEGIFQTTPEGRCINANPALARILGFDSPQQVMAEVQDVGREIYLDGQDRGAFLETINRDGRVVNFEFRARRRDANVIWVVTNARMVADKDGRVLYYEGFLEDMTLRKEAQERLEHQAYHDPLTGLPNRMLFQDHLAMALSRQQRRPMYAFAVLYLDLDRFKVINDSLGHAVGDELLVHVAAKLRECVRDVDTVARFGGDEFGVLLEEIAAPREAVRVARRIGETLGIPVTIEGHEVFTSASVGIVLKTGGYVNPQEVLRDADTAMYRAKELGKSRFKVFNQRMHEEVLRLMALETELRKAVERSDFEVNYQPIIDLESQRICGFEALVRWHHESLGEISPSEFIPLAEDSGLILEIGDFVLEEAVRNILRWNTMEIAERGTPLFVCINISGRQFMQPDFAGHVESRIREWNINTQSLRFEITESVLMQHMSVAVDTVGRLRALGVQMCIDDFGTGYSSLSYLQRLPVDTIKIDRSFIAQLGSDREGRSIVRSVLTLGDSLGLEVVAEGVEHPSQESLLQEMACRYVQGFLYSPGLSREAVDALLSMENPLAYLKMSQETDDFKVASGL